MSSTWINETENDIEELQITHEDITERTPLTNKLHILKVSRKNPEEKQELFGLREKRETQGKNEREIWRET